MIDNYFIQLQKNTKIYSVHCKNDVIIVNSNGCIDTIIHIDASHIEQYWIKCLNLMRKKWHIVKANNLPPFDISYVPSFNTLGISQTLLPNYPCILIPNCNVYTFDIHSKYIWENTKTQIYFPKNILHLLSQLNDTIEFCQYDSSIMLLPTTMNQYSFLTKHTDLQLPPFYKTYTQAILPIKAYDSLWKSLRFLDKHDYSLM